MVNNHYNSSKQFDVRKNLFHLFSFAALNVELHVAFYESFKITPNLLIRVRHDLHKFANIAHISASYT